MALPVVRSVGANAVGTTSATPGEPAGAVQGDLLLCIVASAGAAAEPTMTADWTKIRTVKNGTALTDSMLTVFRAIRGASAPSYVVSGTTNHVSARVIAVTTGTFDATTPIHVESGGNVQTSTTAVSISGLTTTLDDCLIFSVSGASLPDANSTAQYTSWANAALANGVEQTDNNTSQGNGGGHGTWAATKQFAGAIGATTATKASAALLANLMFAVAPASTPRTEQYAMRGRNDDGTLATATWKAAQNTGWTQPVDENFRVRTGHEEDAGAAKTVWAGLQYRLNGGTWTNVTAASLVVQAVASPNVADGAAVATGDFVLTGQSAATALAGLFDEVDGKAASSPLNNQYQENEFCVQILAADVANEDIIELRVFNFDVGQVLDSYVAGSSPTITVSETSNQNVAVTGRTSSSSFGAVTPSTGPVTVAVSGRTSTSSYGAVIPVATITVAVAGRTSGSTYGTVTTAVGNVNVAVAGRTSSSSYGAITTATGNVNVSVAGRTSTSTYGAVTASSGGQFVSVAGRTSVSTYGAVTTAAGTVTVSVAGRASNSSYGTPTILVGGVTVQVAGRTSASSFGSVSIPGEEGGHDYKDRGQASVNSALTYYYH